MWTSAHSPNSWKTQKEKSLFLVLFLLKDPPNLLWAQLLENDGPDNNSGVVKSNSEDPWVLSMSDRRNGGPFLCHSTC